MTGGSGDGGAHHQAVSNPLRSPQVVRFGRISINAFTSL